MNKNRPLIQNWTPNVVLYDDYKMQVICSPDYELGNDIGVYWKDTDDGNTAYPLSKSKIQVAPLRLNRNLALALLKGILSNKEELLKNHSSVTINEKDILRLISIYEKLERTN